MYFGSFLSRLLWFAKRCVRGTRYQHLFSEIRTRQPRHIMEIGTWSGQNALKMIKAAAVHRPASEIYYYGFDLFESMTEDIYLAEVSKRPPSQEEVQRLLEATGANIKLFVGDTNVVLSQVLPQLPAPDFVFIDGGHSISTIQNDWDLIKPELSEKSVVIFDDYWSNRVDAGCKVIVDSIDTAQFDVKILSPTDHYHNKTFGRLDINFAKVSRI